MKPFFSIIIPLYNKENYILDTLNSVLNQSFANFEIIIIDDGSTDNGYKIVSQIKDDRIKLFKQKNLGVSITRNVGVKKSKGKYIALIDADDLWYENHLKELKKQINLFPKAALFCNNYEIIYNKNKKSNAVLNFEYKKEPLIVKDYFKASIINSVAWTSAVSFSKEKFNKIGGFNEKLITGQDLDLWIRFALNHNVSFNPSITISYRFNVNNSLSKKELNEIRYVFINSFSEHEKLNKSLKLYLDVNRYAIALRCKMNREKQLYKKTKQDIYLNNLNFKQKLLLKFPRALLILIKKLQYILLKTGIYLNAHK